MKTRNLILAIIAVMLCGCKYSHSNRVYYENHTSQNLKVKIYYSEYKNGKYNHNVYEVEFPQHSSLPIYGEYDVEPITRSEHPAPTPIDDYGWRCEYGYIDSVIMTDKNGTIVLRTALPYDQYPLVGHKAYSIYDIFEKGLVTTYTIKLTDEMCQASLGLCPCSEGDSAITVTNAIGKIYAPTATHIYSIPLKNTWMFESDDGLKYLLGDMPQAYRKNDFLDCKVILSGTGTTINSDDEQLRQYAGCLTDYTITKQ